MRVSPLCEFLSGFTLSELAQPSQSWLSGAWPPMRSASDQSLLPFRPSPPKVVTMPSADFCPPDQSRSLHFQSRLRDGRQISRGKYDRVQRTTAGFTSYAFDGYGLCDHTPARPALAPHIRFLFIGSRLCSALPSDPASRRRPCAPLPFTSTRLGEDFHFQAVAHARHT